jgi:hypothetical protein
VLETHDDEIGIKVTSSNAGLVKLDVTEVKLLPKQASAKFTIRTSPTPIKTVVVINAVVATNNLVQSSRSIEVVPALIASAQLSTSSFVGTHGAKTSCQLTLKAPAPPGGIQVYLSPLKITPSISSAKGAVTIHGPTRTIPAGKDGIDIDIPFDAFIQGGNPISQDEPSSVGGISDFNTQSRSIELVVALEPQGTNQQWVAIPGIASKLTFEVVPLRITSLSVQPSTLNGGEALASFTLSAPPGNSEHVLLKPIKSGSASKLWATPLGVSCAATPTNVSGDSNKLQLVQGTTTYQFKVCSGTVSTVYTGHVRVYIRSGDAEATVTVQP